MHLIQYSWEFNVHNDSTSQISSNKVKGELLDGIQDGFTCQ